jgi:hypothetical protein
MTRALNLTIRLLSGRRATADATAVPDLAPLNPVVGTW